MKSLCWFLFLFSLLKMVSFFLFFTLKNKWFSVLRNVHKFAIFSWKLCLCLFLSMWKFGFWLFAPRAFFLNQDQWIFCVCTFFLILSCSYIFPFFWEFLLDIINKLVIWWLNFRLYFTKVRLGSPPREFNVQIDTGSDILWVNCNACNDCPQTSGLGVEFFFLFLFIM